MAKRNFIVDLDLNQNELLKAKLETLATAPLTPVLGQIYYDSAKSQIGVCINATGPVWSYGGDIIDVVGTAPIQVSVSGAGVATITIDAATGSTAGSMSATDKNKLDGATATATASTLVLRDASGNIAVNTITINNAPTAGTDGVNKTYVDGLLQGLDVRASVRAITTGNITLSGLQTVDTVVLAAGNRVLVTSQTTTSQDGVYIVSATAWTRATDFALGSNVANSFMFVEEGTFSDTGWVCTNNVGSDAVGTNDLIFVQFSAAGTIDAGAGLTKTGNNIDVIAGDNSMTINANDILVKRDAAGAITVGASGILVNTDTNHVTIAANALTVGAYVAKHGSKTISLGVTPGAQTVTHNLGTRNVQVNVYDATTFEELSVQIVHTTTNTVVITANGGTRSAIAVVTGNTGAAF
jgi:hypothetical protein